MRAEAVSELFDTILPRVVIMEAVRRLGVQKRARFLDPVELVIQLVLLGGTAEAGRLGAVLREYMDVTGRKLARSAAYRWFDEEFLALMKELVARALAYTQGAPVHLPGVLAGRTDWRVVDSTTVKLLRALVEDFPGTGDYAALKVHVELSLGCENVVDYSITPARRHDSVELVVDEKRRGTGLIVDLGYVSHKLLRACQEHDVQVVVRLKGGWKVFMDSAVKAGEMLDWKFPEAFAAYFDGGALPATLEVPLDVDVRLGGPNGTIVVRLVNIETPEGWRAYLTTVPRATHNAEAVAFLYRLRWGVELQNKLAKSGCQLDEIDAVKPVSAEILVHASMLASIIANGLAHLEHLHQGMVGEKVVKPKRPPHHAMLEWKCVRAAAARISALLAHPDAEHDGGWERVAGFLQHAAADPNWRRSPSPIDDAKGRNAEGRAFWRSRPTTPRVGARSGGLK